MFLEFIQPVRKRLWRGHGLGQGFGNHMQKCPVLIVKGFIGAVNLVAHFSKLTFVRLQVDRAGNDCLDLSYGDYRGKDLVLKRCGDKAVSVGETSKAERAHSSAGSSRSNETTRKKLSRLPV